MSTSVEADSDPVTNHTWDVTLNVRSSSRDVLIATVGIGIIISMFFLYLIYLLVRHLRSKQPGYQRSKADRPSWLLGLLLGGSAWIFCTLMATGVVTIVPENSAGCTFVRFLGQYLFGYVLWISMVLYKLIRKYVQLRLVSRKPPHALLAIGLLLLPYLAYTIVVTYMDMPNRDDNDICMNDEKWLWGLYSGLLLYVALFIFLLTKIRKTIGAHHELIRYSIFLCSSFIFPIFDATVQLSDMRVSVAAQQFLVILAMFLVVVNLSHVFALVFKINRKIRDSSMLNGVLGPEQQMRSPTVVSISSVGSEYYNSDPQNSALDDINAIISEGPLEKRTNSAPLPNLPSIVLHRPRRLASDEMLPNFELFVDNLPEDLASQVDRNRGYFAYRSRPKKRAVVEFDLDLALKYLESDKI